MHPTRFGLRFVLNPELSINTHLAHPTGKEAAQFSAKLTIGGTEAQRSIPFQHFLPRFINWCPNGKPTCCSESSGKTDYNEV